MGILVWTMSGLCAAAILVLVAYGTLLSTYIVARDQDDAVIAYWRLLRKGYGVISEPLGEFVRDKGEAARATEVYLAHIRMLARLAIAHPGRVAVAVKPTAIGVGIDWFAAAGNAHRICTLAAKVGVFVWFDAEKIGQQAMISELALMMRRNWPDVGLCLQSMHARSKNRVIDAAAGKLKVRLVKGAYGDGDIKGDEAVTRNLVTLMKESRQRGGEVATGSCDDRVIAETELDQELQLLWGVRTALAGRLRAQGRRVTIFCSYGSLKAGHGYFTRRLKEGIRPKTLLLFARNILEARRFRKSLTRA